MRSLRLRQLIAFLAVAAGVALTATSVLTATRGVLFPFSWTANYGSKQHGITLDAGSHGTRAHLFQWSGRVQNSKEPLLSPVTIPIEIAVFDPGLPGIAGFAKSPQDIGPNVLAPLISLCLAKLKRMGIDTQDIRTTPIFLKATAGMRNTDIDTRDQVMGAIREYLSNKTLNPFLFHREWARVISGEEEGVFGWISVNNKFNTLLEKADATYGALDLGGASSQITFFPTTTSVLEDFYQLKLGERVRRLYSHSFLGYGWSDARMRISTRIALEKLFERLASLSRKEIVIGDIATAILAGKVPHLSIAKKRRWKRIPVLNAEVEQSPVAEMEADHPCFPRGYENSFDLPSVIYPDGRFFLDIDARAILAYINALGINLNDPVVKSLFSSEVVEEIKRRPIVTKYMTPVMGETLKDLRRYGSGWGDDVVDTAYARPFHPNPQLLPPRRLQIRLKFKGSGNFTECQQRAKELFYQEPCFLSTCSFNGVYQPRITENKFLALGQYAKVRQALNMPVTGTPNTLEKKAAEACETEWSVLTMEHEMGKYRPFSKNGMASLCWKAIWAHATLVHGFGFDGESRAVTYYDMAENQPVSKAPVQSPGWAFGGMVAEISTFPWQNSFGRYKAPFWSALISCILLILLACAQHFKIRRLYEKQAPRALRSDVYHEFSRNLSGHIEQID